MKTRFISIVALLLTLLLSACAQDSGGGQSDGDGAPPPGEGRPLGIEVIQVIQEGGFDIDYYAEPVSNLEWDIEIEFDTRDLEQVYDFYVAWLEDELGATVIEEEREGDEIEANFSRTGDFEGEISVDLDDGRVEFDFDVDVFDSSEFDILAFSDENFPLFPEDVHDVEWDFSYEHSTGTPQEVFDHYDAWLTANGWTQDNVDDDDDGEFEAEYSRQGVWLELEVEDDDDGSVEVEWEINKARFYGSGR